MPDFQNNPTVLVNLGAIVRNYKLLKETGGKNCAAVVKANAYGLGVASVSGALYAAGCREFFVSTLAEGIELRQILPSDMAHPADIYVFHGARRGETKDFIRHGIIPVLNDLSQVEYWQSSGKYALHIDTGMCRLGLTLQDTARLQTVDDKNLCLVISHLACANEPGNSKNSEQLALFQKALLGLPGKRASLANSSGVFLGDNYSFDLLRPGCALYGISPNTSLPNPMESVATVSAPVLQYRRIDKKQSVGYGASANVNAGSVLATVEIGYADGILRTLGNKIHGFAGGIKLPIVGRVSMDMVSVDVTMLPEHMLDERLRITFIGKEQTVDVVAESAGTIGYEIFTRIGARVQRLYSSV